MDGNLLRVVNVARSSGTYADGHEVSDEVRAKIGASKKDNKNFLGRKHSEETKAKMRKPKTEEHKRKLSEFRKGKKFFPHSIETRAKMSKNNGQLGNKSIWWKGGRTEIRDRVRSHFFYRQWRCDVFQRDDYTCQMCGKRGGRLQADHIKPFYAILDDNEIITIDDAVQCEELWNINNGRTLCIECHKNTESYLNRWYQNNAA